MTTGVLVETTTPGTWVVLCKTVLVLLLPTTVTFGPEGRATGVKETMLGEPGMMVFVDADGPWG